MQLAHMGYGEIGSRAHEREVQGANSVNTFHSQDQNGAQRGDPEIPWNLTCSYLTQTHCPCGLPADFSAQPPPSLTPHSSDLASHKACSGGGASAGCAAATAKAGLDAARQLQYFKGLRLPTNRLRDLLPTSPHLPDCCNAHTEG